MKILILPLILASTLFAAPPKIVRDINNNYQGRSYPLSIRSGTKTYFVRGTAEFGQELWVSDGTSANLVKDIEPGAEGSNIFVLLPVTGGGVYFTAATTLYGRELWFSDGTESGTKIVKDILPGSGSGITSITPQSFYVLPGTSFILFPATDGVNGVEPWLSNGTSAGTNIIANINTGAFSSNPRDFYHAGAYIFFSAETLTNGREPYYLTGGSVFLLSNIAPGSASSDPTGFILNSEGTRLLFNANDGTNGKELWQSTIGTTSLVKDIVPGSLGGLFANFTSLLTNTIFFHIDLSSSTPISKIMKSDGTTDGTTTLKDLNCVPGGILSINYSEYIIKGTATNNKMIFPCVEISTPDKILAEPWVTDGTTEGTKMLADIFPGSRGSYPFGGIFGQNRGVFAATDGMKGMELWTTNGESVSRLADYNPGELSSYDFDSLGFFALLSGNIQSDSSVWYLRKGRKVYGVYTDGLSLVDLFDDSDLTKTASSDPYNLTPFKDSILFGAKDSKFGQEPFISNGTKRGTKLLKNIFKAGDSNPYFFHEIPKDRALFIADSVKYGNELWITDGKKTSMLKDIAPKERSGVFSVFKSLLKNKVIFTGGDETTGEELWITNFTKRGTKLLKDIRPGTQSSLPSDLVVFKKKGYFSANDGTNGSELWVTNGKTTSLFSDIRGGSLSSSPAYLTVVGNKLFFAADDGINGRELWMTDGITASLVKDIYPGAIDSYPKNLVASGGKLFFVAKHPTYGEELWVSDGTEAGTNLVSDIYTGVSNSDINYIVPFSDGRIMFRASSVDNGAELWISDGASVSLVKDIVPGVGSSSPEELFRIPKKRLVYFSAQAAPYGRELWRSDGTEAGTVFISDINDGEESSSPFNFTFNKRRLYFTADDGVNGRELYSVRVN